MHIIDSMYVFTTVFYHSSLPTDIVAMRCVIVSINHISIYLSIYYQTIQSTVGLHLNLYLIKMFITSTKIPCHPSQ